MDQLYDQVDIKTNIRRVPPSAVTTENIVSQYSELQASDPVDQLYAQVDKKQKGKKRKKEPADSHSSETVSSQPPVMELYAQVDKKKKRKKKTTDNSEPFYSEPHAELYAQMDKK